MAKKSTQKESAGSIAEALDLIEKKFGQGSIMKMGEAKKMNIGRINTGSISLDIALGGGMPQGRIIEIYGPESSGKTTLSLHCIAECQKKNFGYIRFDNRTDKNINLYETINLIYPYFEIPPNCITYTKADSGKIIYKLDFLNCAIYDKYGQFNLSFPQKDT